MTIKEFLGFLGSGEWELDQDGNLSDGDDRCPLWHVYEDYFMEKEPDEVDPAEDYVEAGRRCGLRARDAIAIARAADNGNRPIIRRRLLAAVGLAEGEYWTH